MSAPTDVCSTPDGQQPAAGSGPVLWPLDPMALPDHIDVLYRAAWALCGSRHEAEDLVQDTFARVLKRPRLLRSDNEVGYLLRALRNTNAARHRAARRRPITVRLVETDFNDRAEIAGTFDARELMEAIAATPRPYRDAVVAVDVVGMSYRQAARHLRTREVTITSRLSRGRQHVPTPCASQRAHIEVGGLQMPIGFTVLEWSLLVTGRSGTPQCIATIEYLLEVAKDWTLARFAAAEHTEFVLVPHRFELCGARVRRHALPPDSREAASPVDAIARAPRPTVWSHSTLVTLLADSRSGTVEFEQEMVEILAMDGETVLAEAAAVIRIPGLAPCLGPFH